MTRNEEDPSRVGSVVEADEAEGIGIGASSNGGLAIVVEGKSFRTSFTFGHREDAESFLAQLQEGINAVWAKAQA